MYAAVISHVPAANNANIIRIYVVSVEMYKI
jgi:hypothetical protein